jgi:hypothetical protein
VSDEDDEKAEQERRRRVNLVSAIAVLLLIVGGYWLFNYLQRNAQIEACIESGRRDCLTRFDPAAVQPR